jgi:hypothetical protein
MDLTVVFCLHLPDEERITKHPMVTLAEVLEYAKSAI